MDNLAHTLVGAALARAVAGSRVARAATAGAVAANAPDWIELIIGLAPGGAYLILHRGITHSLAAALVETLALILVIGWGARWWIKRRGGRAPPWGPLAAATAATVYSHLVLDWQGSYGLRPFLPWQATWYYGDWVAIVDPFFWLVPLIALAWGQERHWIPLTAVLLAGALMTFFLGRAAVAGRVALWVLIVFAGLTAVGCVGWLRYWFGPVARRQAAALAILLLGLYTGAQGIAAHFRKAEIRQAALARFDSTARWAALTNPGRPFTWDAIYASDDTIAGDGWQVPRHLDVPVVQRAIRDTPEGRAMAQFARFLAADVDSTRRGDGVIVYLRDARYARAGRSGWGIVTVRMN
ncbi:MAG: metal-dependent hydrolase [Gemmatimonadales bacterium]